MLWLSAVVIPCKTIWYYYHVGFVTLYFLSRIDFDTSWWNPSKCYWNIQLAQHIFSHWLWTLPHPYCVLRISLCWDSVLCKTLFWPLRSAYPLTIKMPTIFVLSMSIMKVNIQFVASNYTIILANAISCI